MHRGSPVESGARVLQKLEEILREVSQPNIAKTRRCGPLAACSLSLGRWPSIMVCGVVWRGVAWRGSWFGVTWRGCALLHSTNMHNCDSSPTPKAANAWERLHKHQIATKQDSSKETAQTPNVTSSHATERRSAVPKPQSHQRFAIL